MLERLRRALVRSYVGAIGLGWLFAQGILQATYVFSTPLARWLVRRDYRGIMESRTNATPVEFALHDSVSELLRAILILVVGYVLLRWLYYRPTEEEARPDLDEGTAEIGAHE